MNLNYAPGGPLQGRFPLPMYDPSTTGGFPHMLWSYILFIKDDAVIRYYTFVQDWEIFHMAYSEGQWYMTLHTEDDVDWIPADGCEWKFGATDMKNEVLKEQEGTLEVWKRV